MTKKSQYSIDVCNNSIKYLKEILPLEIKRYSQIRHKQISGAFNSLNLHLQKLNIEMPKRTTFYNPEFDFELIPVIENLLEEAQNK